MKAVVLLSGGIDSPVAAHLMMGRGARVTLLHMSNAPAGDPAVRSKVDALAAALEEAGGSHVGAYIAPHGETWQGAIARAAPARLQCVLCKRAMLRTAEALCGKLGAGAIVTGESLGQVASQTLPNMRTEDAAVRLPVLRPLVGMDKVEIIDIAREAGTFEISITGAAECPYVPEKPATSAATPEAEEAESGMDLDGLLRETIGGLVKIR